MKIYLQRRDAHFCDRGRLNAERQNRRDGLELTHQIVAQVGLVVPLVEVADLQIDAVIVRALVFTGKRLDRLVQVGISGAAASEQRRERRLLLFSHQLAEH